MNDTIYRQMALDALNEQIEQCDKALSSFNISMEDEYAIKVERASLMVYKKTIEYIPSVQPKRKTGKWIYCKDICGVYSYRCNKCGYYVPWDYTHKPLGFIGEYHFCPNCGVRMMSEQNECKGN